MSTFPPKRDARRKPRPLRPAARNRHGRSPRRLLRSPPAKPPRQKKHIVRVKFSASSEPDQPRRFQDRPGIDHAGNQQGKNPQDQISPAKGIGLSFHAFSPLCCRNRLFGFRTFACIIAAYPVIVHAPGLPGLQNSHSAPSGGNAPCRGARAVRRRTASSEHAAARAGRSEAETAASPQR